MFSTYNPVFALFNRFKSENTCRENKYHDSNHIEHIYRITQKQTTDIW